MHRQVPASEQRPGSALTLHRGPDGSVVRRSVLPGGLRVITEAVPAVRSVSFGLWVGVGSRDETESQAGATHFLEHLLFKGTSRRSALDISSSIDSLGGEINAFTAKEYAAYYIRVLDEHLPIAVELLADMVMHPAMAPEDVLKEQGVILEEIKMVEDAPDDLVHEVFTRHFWLDHPLGRPILGTPDTVSSFTSDGLRQYFSRTYTAPNLIVAAAGNFDRSHLRDLVARAFADLPTSAPAFPTAAPGVSRGLTVRHKDIEQSHICLGTGALSQGHDDRHVAYILNTILGGSMSSRLFQHIREERGLAYAVFSNLTSYSDAGMLTVYAGCAADKVGEVVDLHRLCIAQQKNYPEKNCQNWNRENRFATLLSMSAAIVVTVGCPVSRQCTGEAPS